MKSTRSGKTFSGTVTSRLPRASNIDPGFGAMNLPAGGREGFGRLGARAGDQDVDRWNSGATAFNEATAANKATEIEAYDTSVDDYNSSVTANNDTREAIDRANQYATEVNTAAGVYRGAGAGKGTYDAAKSNYDFWVNKLGSNSLVQGTEGMFDGSSQSVQYGSPITTAARDMGYSAPVFRIDLGGKRGYQRMTSVTRQSPLYDTYIQAGGRNGGAPSRHIGASYNPDYLVGAIGRGAYNPWSDQIYNSVTYDGSNHQDTANVPFFAGGYETGADQYGWQQDLTAPPDAPDPFYEQRQMQDALPSRLDRQLSPDQREIVGGDLPPQVAGVSGDTFGQSATQFRELSQINHQEQQTLGSPKAYRAPSWYWTAKGQYGSGGGQTVSPSEITNENSTSFHIRGYGWILKSQMTPLY